MFKSFFILSSLAVSLFAFDAIAAAPSPENDSNGNENEKYIYVSNFKNVPIVFQSYRGQNEKNNYKFSDCFQVPDAFKESVSIDAVNGTIALSAHKSVPFMINNSCFSSTSESTPTLIPMVESGTNSNNLTNRNQVGKSFHVCQEYCYNPLDPTETRMPKPSSFFELVPAAPLDKQLHYYFVDKCTRVVAQKTLTGDVLAINFGYSGNESYRTGHKGQTLTVNCMN